MSDAGASRFPESVWPPRSRRGRRAALVVTIVLTIAAAAAIEKHPTLLLAYAAESVDRFFRPLSREAVLTARVPDGGAAALAPTFHRLEGELERLHSPLRMRLAGAPIVAARTHLHTISGLHRGLAIALVVICVTMAVLLRSVWSGLVAMVPNLLPVVGAAAMLAMAGRPLQYISVVALAICLGLAVDDTIHYLVAARREAGRGRT